MAFCIRGGLWLCCGLLCILLFGQCSEAPKGHGDGVNGEAVEVWVEERGGSGDGKEAPVVVRESLSADDGGERLPEHNLPEREPTSATEVVSEQPPERQPLPQRLELQAPHLPNGRIDVLHYALRLAFPTMKPTDIQARVIISVKLLYDDQVIQLHVESDAVAIQSVQVADTSAQWTLLRSKPLANRGLTGSVLQVSLPDRQKAGSTITLTVKYSIRQQAVANPNYRMRGLFFWQSYLGTDIFASRNWPYYARFWIPSHDHPSDPATVSFELLVPDGVVAAANGVLTEGPFHQGSGLDPQTGLRVFRWQQSSPIPTYGIHIAVGTFKIVQETFCFRSDTVNHQRVDCSQAPHKLPVVLYLPPQSPMIEQFKASLQKGLQALVYFSSRLGLYPYKKFGITAIPHPFSMESVTLVALTKPEDAVHEVLHHWWGNTVFIAHWGELWLSEGITTYLTGMFDERTSGKNTACALSTGKLNHPPGTDPVSLSQDVVYCTGAQAIHALRMSLANIVQKKPTEAKQIELFFHVLKELYQAYQGRHLSTPLLFAFLRKHLSLIYQNHGYQVTQQQVDQLVAKWQSQSWFQQTKETP